MRAITAYMPLVWWLRKLFFNKSPQGSAYSECSLRVTPSFLRAEWGLGFCCIEIEASEENSENIDHWALTMVLFHVRHSIAKLTETRKEACGLELWSPEHFSVVRSTLPMHRMENWVSSKVEFPQIILLVNRGPCQLISASTFNILIHVWLPSCSWLSYKIHKQMSYYIIKLGNLVDG